MSTKPRPLLLNVWIAGELVASLLDRNLALEDVRTEASAASTSGGSGREFLSGSRRDT